MSVDRDTLARVHGIPTEQVRCDNCIRHSEFINKVLWCDGLNAPTRADEFCSFYVKDDREEEDDEKCGFEP